jgi:hypothetical protein
MDGDDDDYALVAPRVEPGQALRDFIMHVNALKAENSNGIDGFEREFTVRG